MTRHRTTHRRTSRRQFLAGAAAGAAPSAGFGRSARPATTPDDTAGAAADPTTPPDDTASGTATVPPGSTAGGTQTQSSEQPVGGGDEASEGTGQTQATTAATVPVAITDGDKPLLSFVQTLELAAAELYEGAFDTGGDNSNAIALSVIADNHTANANLMSAVLGVEAPRRRSDDLYEQFSDTFATSADADAATVAAAGYELESVLVATYAELVGQITSVDALTPVAAMVMTEARHCAVLADIAGKGDDLDALLDNTASPLEVPAEG